MTTNSVTLEVQLTQKGLSDLLKGTAQIRDNLESAAKISNKIGPAPKSASAPSGTGETKTARSIGSGAGTGSASSDFAAQASGLGGLVHVYATFAANIFALSAAFSALSKSMDTTNLVKGLDQLGAVSGRNLGSLAKQMVAVADGAISMQQAMSSTAMASAGGMSSQAILRLTEVAKKASLALGRDMSDSMDRLTKGIVKVQPELLDELGIMTRVIPAQQEYARQIGKTIGALTDFEKRQAFANAVLAEGEKKFGNINLDANPYSKLAASISNLVQSGLEFLNRFLGPLVNMLSQSPTGLALALGAVATVLLKQALPAIGMFRENNKRMAQEGHARIASLIKDQQEYALRSDEIAEKSGQKQYQNAEATQKKTADLLKAKFNSQIIGKDLRNVLGTTNAFALSPDELAGIKARSETLLTSQDDRQKKEGAKLKSHLAEIDKLRAESNKRGADAREANVQSDEKWYSHQELMNRRLKNLNDAASKRDLLSRVGDTAATLGPTAALKDLGSGLKDLNGGILGKIGTGVKGLATIATSAISTAVGAFGAWGQAIAIVGATIAFLDSQFTSSAKQVAAYEVAIDALTSSFDNVDRTLEVISKKSLADFLSVESIQAKANALNDLTGNLSAATDKFIRLLDAQNGWDKFFDGFWDFFGKGSADKLSAGISMSVIDSMKLLEEGPAKKKAQEAIQSILGQDVKVDFKSFKAFNAAIKDLDAEDVGAKGKLIQEVLANASREANNGAAALTSFKTALADIGKSTTDLSNALMPKDDFSKLGVSLMTASSNLSNALKEPINGLTALRDLAKDTNTLSLLPKDTQEKLVAAKQKLEDISATLAAAKKEQEDADIKIGKANETMSKWNRDAKDVESAREILAIEGDKLKLAKERISAETANAAKIVEDNRKVVEALAQIGYDNLAKGLAKSLSEAAIVSARSYLDAIKQAGGFTAAADAELSKQAIQLQIADINARYSNTLKLTELTLSMDKNTAEQELARLDRSKTLLQRQGGNTKVIDDKIATALKTVEEISKAQEIMGKGSNAIREFGASASSGTDIDKGASARLQTILQQSFGKDSALAGLIANLKSADLNKDIGTISDTAGAKKQKLGTTSKGLASELESINNLQTAKGLYDESLQTQKEIVNKKILNNKYDLESVDINKNIEITSLVISKLKEKGKLTALEAVDLSKATETLEEQKGVLEGVNAEKRSKQDIEVSKNLRERLALKEISRKYQQDNDNREYETTKLISQARLTADEVALESARQSSTIIEADYITQKSVLDLSAQQIGYDQQIYDLGKKKADDEAAAKIRFAENGVELKSQLALIGNAYKQQSTSLEAINAAKILGITHTSEQTAMLATQNKEMDEMQKLAESLSVAFGDTGAAIGKLGNVLLKVAHTEEQLAKQKKDAGKDSVKLAKYENDKTKSELNNIQEISGATKSFFNEKSKGYQVLSAIEKASAIASAAIRAQELASKASDALKSIGIDIPVIYAKAMSQLGPIFGPIAATAAIAAFLGMAGGGSSSPSGPTAEDLQKSQGTGQSYDSNGKLQDNGGGALGDSSKKSTAIKDGIDTLAKINYEMLDFGKSKTYEALIAIQKNTEGFVKAVGSALKSGTIKSVEEGTSYNANILGKNKSLSLAAVGILGTVFSGAVDKLSEALGLGPVFGEKVDRKVQDTGINVSGTLVDVIGGKGTQQMYQKIRDEWSSFLDHGVNEFTKTDKLDPTITKYLTNIFGAFKDVLLSATDVLGSTITDATQILDMTSINLSISSKGLTGEEFAAAIMAEIGIQLDIAAKKAFPNLAELETKFQALGETTTDFIIRLIDTTKNVNLALESVGISLGSLTGVAKTIASMQLADAAGGLDNFMSLINNFGDAFLTEAERLAPVQRALVARLVELGFASVDTRDEFKQTITSWSDWSEAGTKTYVELLKLAPAFDKVTASTETAVKTMTALEIAASRTDQYITILGLLGKKEDALRLTRAKELAGMDERLRGTQTYIYYLEDLNKAQEVFNSSLSSLGDTLFGLQNQLLTAQGAANNGAGASDAKAAIQQRTRTRDLAKMTTGLSATQAAAVTTAYDYNTAISNQIEAQNAANTANTANTQAQAGLATAQEGLAKASADAAKSVSDAAEQIRESWQSVSDSIFDEVARIRGILNTPSTGNLAALQDKLNKTMLAVKNGDSEAAKLLPGLSQSLLTMTEQTATTSLDLKRAQAGVANGLEDVGKTIDTKYGLFGPEDTLARTLEAERKVMQAASDSASSSVAAAQSAVAAAQATADAASATASSANAYLAATTLASETARLAAEAAYKIAKEKGETILTLEQWLASQQYAVENKAYADSITAKTNYFTTMLGLQTAFQDASINSLHNSITAAQATTIPAVTTPAAITTTNTSPPANVTTSPTGTPTTSATTGTTGGGYNDWKYLVPSFDVGTDYVPQDMLALIHRGEEIVPKAYNTNKNQELIDEIRALRAEVANLKEATQTTAAYTKKSSDTLTRVTLGGSAMQTQVAA